MSFDPFEVARSVDIVDLVVNKYHFETLASGRVLYISCPTGTDTTPSFAIFPADNRFKCFHCGLRGTVVDFVMLMENLDTPMAALRHLDRLYPELGIINEQARTRAEHVGRWFGYTDRIVKDNHNRLMSTPKYLEWVKNKRGFSEAAIRKFQLGIQMYDRTPRLAIPLFGTNGRCYTSTTRQIAKEDPMGRYYVRNVRLRPDNGQVIKAKEDVPEDAIEIFTKGSYLYGIDEVNGDEGILLEGQLDRVAGWELGVDNIMAYGTMKISDEQAAQLGDFRRLTLIPDLGAALDEVIHNVEIIRTFWPHMPIDIFDMSPWKDAEIEGDPEFELKDVNDMLRFLTASQDEVLFQRGVEHAIPVEEWLFNRYVVPVAPTTGRAFAEFQKILTLATAPVARVKLVTLASETLGLPPELLMSAR